MGCGPTKLENFEGPPDEEIQFHAKSILLASQSGEKGSGPEARVMHALNGIMKATEQENAQIYPNSIYKLAAAIESLRLEAPQIYMKIRTEIDDVRVSVFKRIVSNPEESDSGRDAKNWATLTWIPRVVSVEPNSVNYLGNSNEYGLTGTGAASLGFCVEAWVFNDKSKKQSDKNLFTLVDASEGPGVGGGYGREVGMTPSMFIDDDGRPVLDFYKKSCLSTKSDLFPPNEWVHVAYVYGSDQMKVYVNGTKVGSKESSPPMGQISLSLCSGCSGGYVTEMRIWMCERSDDEIRETMNKSITPYHSKLYPSLRLCWMPIAKGSSLYSPGALLYDCWRQQFVGSRHISSPILDNRWPSVIPPQLIPDPNYLYASHYCDEIADLWEKYQTELSFNQPMLSKYKPELSILEVKALQIMNILLGYGGPWIPRVVCLAPNSSLCIGTTEELGLSGEGAIAFTLECWIRIRIINTNGHGNHLLEIGRGDPVAPTSVSTSAANGGSTSPTNINHSNQFIQIVLKNGCPTFTLCGETIESDVGLPMMTWTHLAFVFDSTKQHRQQIYANGTLIASSTPSAPVPSASASASSKNNSLPRQSQQSQQPQSQQPPRHPFLSTSKTIIFGSSSLQTSFSSDLCELRLWNRSLSASEINEFMQIAIPPLAGKGYRSLRLTWLPLRNGGPFSQEVWCRRKLILNKLSKPLTPSASKYLLRPLPTLLWDVTQMRDLGSFIKSSDPLLTSRTRFIHIPHLIPSQVSDLPQVWSKAAVAVIDEWTDIFDRAFVPKWYEIPQINEADHEAFAQIPINASEAVMTRNSTWIGRVLKSIPGLSNYSVPIGLTAELGLCGVATGGREFTLELWIKMKDTSSGNGTSSSGGSGDVIFQDLFGHEDKESNESTGFFGMGSPYSLRIGLANGYPFMNFLGQIKSIKPSDLKEGVIAPSPLVIGKWTHLAFVAIGDGKIVLYINGEEVSRRERMNPLQAKGDTVIHVFGYGPHTQQPQQQQQQQQTSMVTVTGERLLQSDICEMRLWSTARTKNEINETMKKCLPPLPSGLPRVPDLRLAWFPTNSMRSLFWDHKYVMIRGVYSDPHMPLESLPKYTRRPLALPPQLLTTLVGLPPCYILDDRGDSYERHLSPELLPPVMRLEDGTVNTSYYDKSFQPLQTKHATHLHQHSTFASHTATAANTSTSSTHAREEVDIGWYDTDDGMLLSSNQIHLDDGGWMECWDKNLLAKFQEEEAVDVTKFVPPVIASRAPSRSPSVTGDPVPNMNEEFFEENFNESSVKQTEQEEFEPQPGEGYQSQTGEGEEQGEGQGEGEGFESQEQQQLEGQREQENVFEGEESPNFIALGSPDAAAVLAAGGTGTGSAEDCLSPKKQDECRSNPDDVMEKGSQISGADNVDAANSLQEPADSSAM